jgi:hypothetical protein
LKARFFCIVLCSTNTVQLHTDSELCSYATAACVDSRALCASSEIRLLIVLDELQYNVSD